MLDVVRRTPAGTTNYTDEAPFIDNAGNNKALLVKGETDINTAIHNLVTDVDALEVKEQANSTAIQNVTAIANQNSTDIDNLQQEVAGITAGLTLNFTTYNIPDQISLSSPTEQEDFTKVTLLESINIASDGFYLVSCFRDGWTSYTEITYKLGKQTEGSPIYAFPLNAPGDSEPYTSLQIAVQGCAVIHLTAGTYKLTAYRYDKGGTSFQYLATETVLSIAKIG